MYGDLRHGQILKTWAERVEERIESRLKEIDRQVERNQWKVLKAFRDEGVGEHHFTPSTGYGFDDLGRAVLEQVVARVFGAEAALVRPHIISGTHAIAACLYGVLRPGDELLYITGSPYDTLHQVIGSSADGSGSLCDYGVTYREVPLTPEGEVDFEGVRSAIGPNTRCIGIQRSRGYADRPSFSMASLEEMIRWLRDHVPEAVIFVDNCYGEFVEDMEPTAVGADLMAGSLIKNPGGGLAKTGGYIAGKRKWVERAASRLVAPGIGMDGGATYGHLRDYFQGLFLAPHIVGQALKGAVFAAALLAEAGFSTSPAWDEPRTDIIQQVRFGDPELLIAFCRGIQAASPVDARLTPEPAPMPGYEDPVIMAAGTFVQGASIELSADGPLRPPYIAYMQGGLTYSHVKIGVLHALDRLLSTGKMPAPNSAKET
ncbi:MAG: aminotransferase class I/II-fold pyridoxal phosphate-dependent enzyme [Planifilum sp.]